jgi:hypothetical protein
MQVAGKVQQLSTHYRLFSLQMLCHRSEAGTSLYKSRITLSLQFPSRLIVFSASAPFSVRRNTPPSCGILNLVQLVKTLVTLKVEAADYSEISLKGHTILYKKPGLHLSDIDSEKPNKL